MRDFAYEQVARGNGIETMATPLIFSPSLCIEGNRIPNTEVLMSYDDFKVPFVPASALGPAIEAAKKLFTQLSPHSHEDWIHGFHLEHLKEIPLCKIQVEGSQKKTTHTVQEEAASEDVERTQKTADHARILFEKSQRGLSGEDFVSALHQSPDIDLARQILRRSNAGGAEVTSPGGSILASTDGKAALELPCAETQTVRIKVAVGAAKAGHVLVHVVDPLEHADFWKYFPEKSIDLEVVDDGDQECLLFSRYLDEVLTAQLNVTVVSPHGRMTRESIQASLSKALDPRSYAQRVVERLTSQYNLNF